MISLRYAMLVVLPALLLLSACGGDDDDSGNGDDSSGDSSPSSSNGSSGSSKNSVNISKIKDGGFSTAKVHIEVSGGKDFKMDLEGNGLATSGFALLAFTSDDGSVQLTLNGTDKDEPGGIGLTARQLASGGGWGQDCSVKSEDGDKELKGEFECKDVEGIEPGSVKTHKVRIRGTFSATR